MTKPTTTSPAKWHSIYRGSEDKCFFVGKDGKSGLARSEYDWRTTDSLSRESGLSKKRTEEIIEYFCKRNVVIQHAKDPEKWGYWERVGTPKADPDPVAKDHQDRVDRQQQLNGGKAAPKPAPKPTLPGGQSTINTPGAGTTPKPNGAGTAPLPVKSPVKKTTGTKKAVATP